MEKITNPVIVNPAKGNDQQKKVKDSITINPDNKSFKEEIVASIKKMEGITEKIKTSFQSTDNKIDTQAIEKDVKEARILLEELTNTFSTIKSSGEKTTNVNISKAIKSYQNNNQVEKNN